jgi:hypothetical protein
MVRLHYTTMWQLRTQFTSLRTHKFSCSHCILNSLVCRRLYGMFSCPLPRNTPMNTWIARSIGICGFITRIRMICCPLLYIVGAADTAIWMAGTRHLVKEKLCVTYILYVEGPELWWIGDFCSCLAPLFC